VRGLGVGGSLLRLPGGPAPAAVPQWGKAMKRSYLHVGFVALTLVAGMPRPAAGTDPARVARARWGDGAKALAAGDLEAARASFLAAYEALPNPELAQSVGEVEYRSGHFADAVRHLRLAIGSEKLSSEERAHSRESLERALQHVGMLTVDVDMDGANVMLDGTFVGRSPLSLEPWYLDPGDYVVAVQHHHDAPGPSKKIVIAAQETTSISFSLATPPVDQSSTSAPTRPLVSLPAPESPSSGVRTAVLVAGAAVAAIASGTGIYFLKNRTTELERATELHDQGVAQFGSGGCAPPTSGSTPSLCQSLANAYQSASRDKTLAVVSFSAAGVVGLATVATLVLWPRPRGGASAVHVAPWLDGGKGIVVRGNF
jgi:hypothetical protein